ncbi:hypothetical protein CTheo_4853 [Ceratobasidium theobromae]|uniref:Uncharacterized protein n=1 Tax=Ceratobasidium theobromae TaxID=1582974 RepID=A0A5N5QJ73_9AGAM|nr:hypothetical protein CTheo_4853 [Ceratobasidium theobromae]
MGFFAEHTEDDSTMLQRENLPFWEWSSCKRRAPVVGARRQVGWRIHSVIGAECAARQTATAPGKAAITFGIKERPQRCESWLSVEQPSFHKVIKQEETPANDFLIYLSLLLDTTSLDDSDDDSDTDLENSSVLSSPRPKCLPQTKNCITTTRIKMSIPTNQVQKQPFPIDRFNLEPDFFIEGIPYCFNIDGILVCQPKEGAEYQKVHTWPEVSPSFQGAPGATLIPSTCTTGGASELNSEIPKVASEREVPAAFF